MKIFKFYAGAESDCIVKFLTKMSKIDKKVKLNFNLSCRPR